MTAGDRLWRWDLKALDEADECWRVKMEAYLKAAVRE